MSELLIKEMTSTPSIAVGHNAVVTGGTGTSSLESLSVQDEASGAIEIVPAAALFVLIGAEPPHSVAARDIERDRWEFVVTGADLLAVGHPPESWPLQRPNRACRVFVVGDVRSGSVPVDEGLDGGGDRTERGRARALARPDQTLRIDFAGRAGK